MTPETKHSPPKASRRKKGRQTPTSKQAKKTATGTKAAAPQAKPPAVDNGMKVKAGDAARAGTFREQIQAHATQPVTVAHLIETLPRIKNVKGKIRNMLNYGTLVVVK